MADYKQIAKEARLKVLEMIYKAQTSHIGSNLSVIDLLTVLYEIAKITKEDWENRDRIIISKGWVAASLYYVLSRKGIIPVEDLELYCKQDSKYIGLAEPVAPGIEFAGGSMGHGLPAAVGIALAAKRSRSSWKTYVVMSDGEMNCGTTWESALIAAQQKLDNLVVIIDYNKLQAMGKTSEVLDLESLTEKWAAFNWEVRELKDGHDHEAIERALTYPPIVRDRPVVIVAHTIKGRGVSFMENKLEWHYKNIDEDSYKKAMEELTNA